MGERSGLDTAVELLGVLVSAALAYVAARQLGLIPGATSHAHHNVTDGYCFTCDKPRA